MGTCPQECWPRERAPDTRVEDRITGLLSSLYFTLETFVHGSVWGYVALFLEPLLPNAFLSTVPAVTLYLFPIY